MPSHSMCCLWATSGCFLMKSTSVGNRNSQPRLTRGAATCSRNSFTSSGGSWRRQKEDAVSSLRPTAPTTVALRWKLEQAFEDPSAPMKLRSIQTTMTDCGGAQHVTGEGVCLVPTPFGCHSLAITTINANSSHRHIVWSSLWFYSEPALFLQ